MTTPGGADGHDPFAAPPQQSAQGQPAQGQQPQHRPGAIPPWEADAFPPPPPGTTGGPLPPPTGPVPPSPGIPAPYGLVTPPPAPGRQYAQEPGTYYGPPPGSAPMPHVPYERPATDMGWANIVGFVASMMCFSVVGIIFSHIGVYQANRGRAKHKGLGVAGLIFGYLGLIVGTWFWIAILSSEEFWFCFENPYDPACTT